MVISRRTEGLGWKNTVLATWSRTSGSACNSSKTPDQQPSRPNILFIPVDDLRPDIGAYGNEHVLTPHMDRLADRGVLFTRTYCQQAVCNPSRASLLTGLSPDSLRVWDLRTKFRDNLPDVVTLPQYFKQHGYTTVGMGKIYHNTIPDTISWTEKPHLDGYPFDPDAVYPYRRQFHRRTHSMSAFRF